MRHLSQIYDVDLKLLRCFCAIVEEGSFTAAQSSLNLSQSMLSEYLKALEVRLGVRLCQRGPKGFKLFPEGEIVYAAAKDLFASVEMFKQRASTLHDGAGYELMIGVQDQIIDNPSCCIVEAIDYFSDYYPNVTFHMEVMPGFKLTGRVADGLLDVGIGLLSERFPKVSAEPIFDEAATMYCGQSHPLFAVPDRQLTREHIDAAAYCSRGHLEMFYPDRVRNSVTKGDVGLGVHAQLALVLSGRNIGLLPDHAAEPLVAAGRLRALRRDLTGIVNPIYAMMGPRAREFRLARRLVDCLVDAHMEARLQKRAALDLSLRSA